MPDSVFIEDTAIVLDELAVITRPGAESRRVETAAVSEAVRGYRPVAAILAPGTLDGGDVLLIGRRLFVGVGYRSNEAGIKQTSIDRRVAGLLGRVGAVRGLSSPQVGGVARGG